MKKGYWVSQVSDIKDMELFQKYFDATLPLVERGDYKLICGGPVQGTLEGDSMIFGAVLEFESLEKALQTYESLEYQEALKALDGGADRDFRIFDGL